MMPPGMMPEVTRVKQAGIFITSVKPDVFIAWTCKMTQVIEVKSTMIKALCLRTFRGRFRRNKHE
jgi:hypothetical protein